ncbi:transmembrane protease serine 5 [Alosa pseudoharengus]|uniref:transmembrane protease serine 5 n=1 Tax=Alosa pseudoharengus TaxID=34774 RepID=UPI003F8BC938
MTFACRAAPTCPRRVDTHRVGTAKIPSCILTKWQLARWTGQLGRGEEHNDEPSAAEHLGVDGASRLNTGGSVHHSHDFLPSTHGKNMSLGADSLSVIENPGAVGPMVYPGKQEGPAGEGATEGPPAWVRGTGAPHQVFRPPSGSVAVQRLARFLVALCVLGLLGGVAVGVWHIVKLLLKPTSSQSPAGFEDTKETSFCNVTDDISVTDPRKVFYRISPENSLLEIQLERLPTWLPVCYERWNSSLGTLVCRQLGYFRLTKHKGVNLTDIGPNYTDGFVQIASEQQTSLESLWQFRGSCSTGKVIALKCFECGMRAKLPRIIGGVEATLGRWPWQVSLYYSNRHTCGGSIITSQWIVTAAHCVHNYRLPQVSSWVVYAGIVTRNSAKMGEYIGHAVEKIIYNKNYNHRTHDNDIALMKLKTPLNFSDTIRPVCLPKYDFDLSGGTQCWISGWGYTQPDDVHIPDTLKEAPVPLISTKKCNSSCMYKGEITPRMLCAGYTEGKVDACQGDSGGPLVCQDDGVWRLVGVVSWGTGCAEPNHPGVYTKVAEFLGWIYDMIEGY